MLLAKQKTFFDTFLLGHPECILCRLFNVNLPWCFHLDMPRNKSRGTKSRGAICFLSADNARNFYQLSISQFEIIAV